MLNRSDSFRRLNSESNNNKNNNNNNILKNKNYPNFNINDYKEN
jgi:hypothetical protein